MTVLGAVFLPGLRRSKTWCAPLTPAGMDELWLWEDCFSESGIASAAAALAWTERVLLQLGYCFDGYATWRPEAVLTANPAVMGEGLTLWQRA